MRRMIPTSLFVVTLLVLMVGSIHAQHTRQFTMTLSGTTGIPLGSEIDGKPLSLGLCGGKTNLPGGSYTCTTTGYSISEFRGFDTANCPNGNEIETVESVKNHIVRLVTGDVQYWVPNLTEYNYSCFYATHATFVSHWLLIGGSGPYEGATGTSTLSGRADGLPLGPYVMGGFHSSLVEGTITFPE